MMSKKAKKKAQHAMRKKGVVPEPAAKATTTSAKTAEIKTKPDTITPWKFSWWAVLGAAPIIGFPLWIYHSVLNGLWLWDDDYLLSQNPVVHSPGGIFDIWLNPSSLIDFFPLTVTVEWLEWQIWPNSPFVFHLTSVILHIISCLLVWVLFHKLGLRFAWLGGLLFAIHPALVESVAWMAELKNTLATPPFLLAAIAWIEFDRTRKIDYYFFSLGLFLVAMLCKTTMVMFPFIILLYAWWKHGRIKEKDIFRTFPFFAISFAIGMAVVIYLRHGVGEEMTPLGGALSRMACAGLSLSFYFATCIFPVRLFPIYPEWDINPPSLVQFLPWPVFAAAFYYLWTKRHVWGRPMLFGIGFFFINLLPFVGFRMISFMRFTWVMDHFLYIPILGLLGLAVAALSQLDLRLSPATRPLRIIGLTVVLLAMAIHSRNYAKIFKNQTALWTYTIHHNPYAWPAYNNLGNVLSDQGRLHEAKEAYDGALRLNPYYPEAHNNLGRIYAAWGQMPQALEQFNLALEYCSDLQSAMENKAMVEKVLKQQQAQPAPQPQKK